MLPRLLLPLVLLAAAPASANAATIELSSTETDVPKGPPTVYSSILVTAAPGETNDLTVTSDGATITFSDTSGTPITGDCTAVTATQRRCSAFQLSLVGISLGDGDDRGTVVTNIPIDVRLSGGAGNDTLTAAPNPLGSVHGDSGDDTLIGSTAADDLDGGPGSDTILGGDGDDLLDGDGERRPDNPIGNDTIDGGAGIDTVTYAYRLDTPVTVDLAAGSGGQPGETDSLAGVENVTGGSASDTLTGDARANRLTGGDGDDVLDGRGGNDVLEGTRGRDTVTCGAGNDLLPAPLVTTLVGRDCDRVRIDDTADVAVTRPSSKRLVLSARRALREEPVCSVRAVVREAAGRKRTLARGSIKTKFRWNVPYTKALTLTAAGTRALRRTGLRVVVRVVADAGCDENYPVTGSYTAAL